MLTKIIHFTSSDCPTVLDFVSALRDVANMKEYKHIQFIHYDIEDEKSQPLIDEYRVETIPNTIFFDEKGDITRILKGKVPSRDLIRYIEYDNSGKILS